MPVSELSVMILCGRSPRHLYVANRLCQAAKPVAIVQEVGSDWSLKKIVRLLKLNSSFRKLWRWVRDRKRYSGKGEAKFFFEGSTPALDNPDLLVEVPHINHPDVISLADKVQPDVIAVFGTSLIRGELLEKGRIGIVNLHGGLSPMYRGADCTFWALYNHEPEKIGCTLHYIDAGIDTGDLIAHICPEVKEDDDELTLFWRAVRDSADAYTELFDRFEAGQYQGKKQDTAGKLYQVKDRDWRHERTLEKSMTKGMLLKNKYPKRIKWFIE